jgi:TonB family protein
MRHLWSGLTILVSLILCDTASAQGRVEVPWPDHFELGLYTFFDFGQRFDFYQLYFVRPTDRGTKVERFILTPAANKCFAPAKLEPASATLSESVRELARMTHREGDVTVSFEIDPNGMPTSRNIVSGHPLLQQAAKDAVGKWKFLAAVAGQRVQATIQFDLNCPK